MKENRRDFIKQFSHGLVAGAVWIASETPADLSDVAKGLGKAAAAEVARRLAERMVEKKLQKQYKNKTKKVNAKSELIVPQGSDWLFSLKFNEGNLGFGNFGMSRVILESRVRSRLQQSLGAKSVASIPQVVEETGERAMLRSNEEIDPETISPKKTIKREGGGLAVTLHVDFLESDGRFGMTSEELSALRDFFTSKGIEFHIEWIKQVCQITLEVWDKDSQTTERGGFLIGMGGATRVTEIDFETFSERGRTGIRRSVGDDREEQQYAAFDKALENLIGQIRIRKKRK